MSEELNIPEVLERLKPYELAPIERVLAAHTGTVQLLLSLWFNEPVDVQLLDQVQVHEEIRRSVALVLRDTRVEAATAKTIIPIRSNPLPILEAVWAGKLGLGQIAVARRIQTTRKLTKLEVNDDLLTRTYVMEGTSSRPLHFVIEETFPRRLYQRRRRASRG